MKKNFKGFTLIELMIVVAVIAIIAAIVIPKFADLIRKSKEASTKGKLAVLRSSLNIYYSDNDGKYPQGTNVYAANITYLQTSLVPKYLQDWPTCYIPFYHKKTDTVDNFPSFSQSWDPACDGEWGYVGNKDDVSWGKIFVECWHTDTKGEEISLW
ncbi:MAG: prepilin-type N-terminal cleavage/methylation domain-containing protein [Elusimicrobiota bacterium]